MILRILFDKERDLKQHVVEKMAGNRAWMQTLLDSIRSERLEWELAEARQKIEE
uniref:Uncharacterized protein n=1 Tax=Romanomermis culicivorax TaxID=13658 RepID=A0A915L2B2_ROMCU